MDLAKRSKGTWVGYWLQTTQFLLRSIQISQKIYINVTVLGVEGVRCNKLTTKWVAGLCEWWHHTEGWASVSAAHSVAASVMMVLTPDLAKAHSVEFVGAWDPCLGDWCWWCVACVGVFLIRSLAFSSLWNLLGMCQLSQVTDSVSPRAW